MTILLHARGPLPEIHHIVEDDLHTILREDGDVRFSSQTYESTQISALALALQVIQISFTPLDEETAILFWAAPTPATLLTALDDAHHVTQCNHEHDCCGCVCGRHYVILSLFEDDDVTYAVIKSHIVRNI